MCSRFNVSDDPLVQGLLEELGIPLRIEPRVNIAPGAKAQIVYETHQGRTLQDAIWSLLIERKPDGTGYRPSPKYSTYNARSGSLGTSPLWKKRFHSQRAIIPPAASMNGQARKATNSATTSTRPLHIRQSLHDEGGRHSDFAKVFGHSSIVMTMRYAHLSSDHLNSVLELNLFNRIC